jgi:hypothetical protein
MSARGENRPEAGRKPVRERQNEPGRLVILDDPRNRSSVFCRVGRLAEGSMAGSAESTDHDSTRRMPRIWSRIRFGELWLPELRCPL